MDSTIPPEIAATEYRRRRRYELTRLVALGRLNPHTAEELAEVEGVGSLLNNPSHDEIDGFAEPRWTLLMAFSWVAFGRSKTVVRNYFPDYRVKCLEWRKEGEGYVPAPMPARTAFDAVEQLTQDRHGDFVRAIQKSHDKPALVWDRLKAKFRSGEVCTEAQKVNDLEAGVVVIPPQNWSGLLLSRPRGVLVDPLCYADGNPVYFNVRVSRDHLLGVWPPFDEDEAQKDEAPVENELGEQVVHVQADSLPETATAAQTRIAKAVLEENYPDGIPYGKGEVKKAFGLLARAFSARAKDEKLTTVNPPSERKWRDIKNGKY